MKNDIATLLRAARFAADRHRDQRRKGADGEPYINHPLGVASVLAVEGGVTDIDVLCAALLHDTIEDTDTSGAELEAEFGPAVRSLVEEVTDDKSLPKERRKALQIEHASALSDKARLVKLADKICNLRDVAVDPPADWLLARRQAYFDWAVAVVDGLRGTHAELEARFDEALTARP